MGNWCCIVITGAQVQGAQGCKCTSVWGKRRSGGNGGRKMNPARSGQRTLVQLPEATRCLREQENVPLEPKKGAEEPNSHFKEKGNRPTRNVELLVTFFSVTPNS